MQTLRLSLTLLFSFLAVGAIAQEKFPTIHIQGDTLISFTGWNVQLNRQGFPEQIRTYFGPDARDTTDQPTVILAENVHFHFFNQIDGKDIRLKGGGLTITKSYPYQVLWKATSTSEILNMDVTGSLQVDSYMQFAVKVTALQDVDLKDVVMHIPFQKDVARSMLGLGRQVSTAIDTSVYHWKWNPARKDWDWAVIGTVNAGLRYSLAPRDVWLNDGKGGIDIGIKGKSMLANNYSGERHLRKGDSIEFDFTLTIMPYEIKK